MIFIANEERPDDKMIRQGFQANPAGAGIAWREKGFVHWKKGLKLDEVRELAANLPIPYVVHFRIPSVGGAKESLTHPFPINKNVQLDLEGKTKDFVLFHNGHWHRWRDSLLECIVKSNNKVPVGRWSDSRAMAFHAHVYGLGFLELIDEKAVAFGPDKIEVFPGQGWTVRNKIWCSNTGWDREVVTDYNRGQSQREGYVPNYTSNVEKCAFQDPPCHSYTYANGKYCYQHRHLEVIYDEEIDDTVPVVARPIGGFKSEEKKEEETTAIVVRQYGAAGANNSGQQPQETKPNGTPGEVVNQMTPFERALALFMEKKLSRQGLKRAKAQQEREEREASRARANQDLRDRIKRIRGEMEETPTILH